MNQKGKTIIYLIGKPGIGKYTIACELARHGFDVCDNQLANNPIFHLLNYDGYSKIPWFGWDAIKKIRDALFDFILIESDNNYVLTNVLNDDGGDKQLYEQVKKLTVDKKSHFIPVKLTVLQDEHLKRIRNISRRERYVLLVGSEGQTWLGAAVKLLEKLGFPIKSYRVANDGDLKNPENNFHEIYEISSTGAVLVRPDGHIAWRCQLMCENAEDELWNDFNQFIQDK